jgi:phospholipid/cholesterol/gamma-HCH transport system permease protein
MCKIIALRWPSGNLIIDQLFHFGVLSLPVVALTGFSTGLVLAAQSFYQLADKGLTGVTGLMVTKAMLTELGPVLTAFMFTGRVGAAMCAEIGSMQVTEQIDAMRSMSVNPLRYLVLPRMIAGISMAPVLTVFSMALGIFGGYLLSVFFFKMSPSDFFDPVIANFQLFDFFIAMAKAFTFGLLVVSICCHRGMSTRGGASGVGKMTTNSVVLCYTIILFINFLLTLGLNSLRDLWSFA